MRSIKTLLMPLFCALAALWMSACGAGGGGTPPTTTTLPTTTTAPAITTQPLDQSVVAGQNASFTVKASGTPTPTFTWESSTDGGGTWKAISGATSATYTFTASLDDSGTRFRAKASNSKGTATSAAALLTVTEVAVAPSITTQPENQSAVVGKSVTFTVEASGTAPLTYQWKKGTTNIGANSSSFTLASVKTTDAGDYAVTITNGAGSITSAAATLTVTPAAIAPTITTQPQNQTVTAGQSASFSVVATGTSPLTYQWKKGTASVGTNSATLTLGNVKTTDAGSYTVTITNAAGSVTSSAATLTVTTLASAPKITTQPKNQSVILGNSATFTVAASGTPSPAFTWEKSTDAGSTWIAIGGATSGTYSFNPAMTDSGARFRAKASNNAGTATSNTATLMVTVAVVSPAITTQPKNQSVTTGQSATFSVVATGTAPLTYQWKKGTANVGSNSATLTLSNVKTADAGSYTVTITNSAGSVTSAAATLIVNPAPVAPAITAQPSSATVTAGQSASFTVAATGTSPLTYTWMKGTTQIATGSATFSIASVTAADADDYTVIISNVAGSITSSAATLTVNTLPAITAQPQSQNLTVGQSASFTVVATGTAPLTYQWLKGGMSITGATSASYTLASVTTADAGSYTVTITNSAGSVTSAAARLMVSSSLAVTITGLQAGLDADVTITGPNSYSQQLTATQTLMGLVDGTYSITAATVTDPTLDGLGRGNHGILGPEHLQRYPLKLAQTVTISGGAATVTVDYPAATLTVQIPDASNPGSAVPMDLVLVPAGSFTMGSPDTETGHQTNETPQHTVTMGEALYVAKTEVTQAQWKAVMNANPSYFSIAGGGSTTDDLTRPVEMVTWDAIRTTGTGFLDRLNTVVPAHAFRLPTEAEWEYACRAGTTTAYFFGADSTNLSTHAWWSSNSSSTTHPVSTLAPNPWGLYDMAGNVWEWNEDDFHDSYESALVDGSAWVDTPARGIERVLRGGSWLYSVDYCRSADRNYTVPASKFITYGFRVVMPVPRT